MENKINPAKPKRKSKSERLHVRRLKQNARKEANYNSPQPKPAQPARPPSSAD